MRSDIVIIGSGFAAYQVIKSLRRIGSGASITVLTADSGDDYNKPDLSHAFSAKQSLDDLIVSSAAEFSNKYQVSVMSDHRVDRIDVEAKLVYANGHPFGYDKLVLATGANTFKPAFVTKGLSKLYSLNNLEEFAQAKGAIDRSKTVSVIGGGLIGVELALDLAKVGKKVTIIEPRPRLLAALVPDYVESKLRRNLEQQDIDILTHESVESVDDQVDMQTLALSSGRELSCDAALLCTGLVPNIELATQIGAKTDKGIVVNKGMQTSVSSVYAIGDCVELDGQVRAFLQPIVLSATVLAKNLAGQQATVTLPPMMIKVKTPSYPIQLAGTTVGERVDMWRFESSRDGVVSKAYDQDSRLMGFVVTGKKVDQAFPLLRELASQ
ncbi:NADH:flavorubredoxin reductase NorW [Vibrio ulleungensis]|uniref:NADH:flavorubredoxin reductase NorW n=1 Tax=Vibrio ulleungensis TaxID=2807619 RepID=A0ABS2HME1_9VIBR|nr:NADH:flavorubredoxin reductase NorW [Vibrio ulleungensis]MBM7037047.1 NADH:flavorubredoxin reductase NorW [Vibrio ulleungensis]